MAARRFFRVCLFVILAIYVVAGVGFAALKFWLLPSIDRWKAPLAQTLTEALGAPVHIGSITAKWNRALPELELKDVAVLNAQGDEVFKVPYAYGRLKLSSLWQWAPHFAQLDVRGLNIHLLRNAHGDFELFGQTLEAVADERQEPGAGFAFYQWLGEQGTLRLQQGELQFTDQLKSGETLTLDILSLKLQQIDGDLLASGDLASLKHAHTKLQFQSQWVLPDSAEVAAEPTTHLDGQLSLQVQGLQPSAWRKWVDIPSFLYQGTMDAHLFARIDGQRLDQVRGDVVVDRPFWADGRQFLSTEPQPFFQAQKAQFHFDLSRAALDMLAGLHAGDPLPTYVPGALWRMHAEDLYLHVPQEFDAPIYFQQASAHFHSQTDNALPIWEIEQVHLDSGAGQLQFNGTVAIDSADWWQTAVALEGAGSQIALTSIYQYFPHSFDPELKQWLQEGLKAGEMSSLRFEWSGLLDDFEHYQEGREGRFRLQAELEDAVLDYYPPDEEDKGWPAIAGMDARLQWENDFLSIQALNEGALLMDGENALVQLEALDAEIQDLYERADLTVRGHSRGAAEDYQYLWTRWDLGEILQDSVQVTHMAGEIEVPLELSVPLGVPLEEMEELVEVRGEVHFGAQSSLQLWPELPPFESLSGVLGFSDYGVSLTEVQGQWLGGPIHATGALGRPDERLQVQAQVQAGALADFYDPVALSALQGEFGLQVELFFDEQEHIHLHAESPLQGLQINLPAPLTKTAESSWPFALHWQGLDQGAERNYLRLVLSDVVTAAGIFAVDSQRIEALSVGTAEAAVEVQEDLFWADLRYERLDLDRWWDWYERVFGPLEDLDWQMPPRSEFRVKADEIQVMGLGLEYFTYTHRLLEPGKWRADVSSDQVAGTVFWQQPLSSAEGAGTVDAHFQRFDILAELWLDEAPATKGGAPEEGTEKQKQAPAPSAQGRQGTAAMVRPARDGLIIEEQMPTNREQTWAALPEESFEPVLEQLPAIKLQVDKLNVRGYELGHLALDAQPLPDASGWQISHFELSAEELMHTRGQGSWQLWSPAPGLRLEWDTEFSDLGAYARYIGLDGLIEGGQGHMSAQFDWDYLPWRSDLYFLSGAMQLDWRNGRLQPVKSRSAKLLELLSLQSLSRIARLDLDIGSALKEGFPFHSIRGSIDLDKGWAATDGYQVLSPVGSLLFEGRTNIKTEVIDARALVIPELDVSGAALAAGMVVNPIVGFGALIAQWILKHPLSDAMTVQYQLSGDWDHFEIEEIPILHDELLNEAPEAE